MTEWNYGDAYLRHPINEYEEAHFDNGSVVKVHNIFDNLPDMMHQADVMFIDTPWNLGNLNTFYTKADRTDYQDSFEIFYTRFFECVAEIRPRICYVEIGKEYLAEYIFKLKSLYKYVTFYNSTYYHSKDKYCYVVKGDNKRKKLPLDGMDEENIIEWICKNEDFDCIGDLCMGRGLVGINAYKNNKKFVGTELNKKRLSVLLERIAHMGGKYEIIRKER